MFAYWTTNGQWSNRAYFNLHECITDALTVWNGDNSVLKVYMISMDRGRIVPLKLYVDTGGLEPKVPL